MMLDYYGIDTILLHDYRVSPILSSFVNHSRMLSAHNPSQDKQLFVSSIQHGQEILTTEFTIFNCPHYIRFLESHNGSQIKPLSVS